MVSGSRLSITPCHTRDCGCVCRKLAQAFKVATIIRRIAALSVAHSTAGFDSPTTSATVKAVLGGIRRSLGTAQTCKAPTITADIRAMTSMLPLDKLIGVRDRAILLIGFSGALRRSEIVALDTADLSFTTDGLILTIRRSKGDQEGEGAKLGIPFGSDPGTCPVRSLQAWLDAAGITSGAVFKSINRHNTVSTHRLRSEAIAEVVKRAVAATGRDSSNYAGHSLRAGLATSAAMAGVEERVIATQTRHKSLVVRRYIRTGSLFRDNASARVGL